MLAEWQDALDGDFSMSLAALQQGWTDPDLQRALQGRQTEYLNLARTEGLMLKYLTRLAEMGNIDEAMTAARKRMTTAEEAFALAKTLREKNHLSEALAIAQARLPLPGNCR